MHPLLQGRLRTFLYLGLWLGVGGLLAALLESLQPRPLGHALLFALPLSLFFGFVCLSARYVSGAHPIGATPLVRLAWSLASAALMAAGVWAGAGALWALLLSALAGAGLGRAGLPGDLTVLFAGGFALYGQSLILHYFLHAFESARAAEQMVYASQVSAREAELRALRAQLNPHFLYNSLNSISALTGSDPESARRMCQLLGDFLRSSLSLGARERVAFSEELALAEGYLAIEQIRYGDRLALAKDVQPEAERCQVPPLLIQPLVENAVKHGVADRVEGGEVRIEARCRGGSLKIVVENPRDPDAPPRRGAGLGLDNVRRRLEALDPRATRVEVSSEPERFRVALTLPATTGGEELRS